MFDSGDKRVAIQIWKFGPSLEELSTYVNELSNEATSALLSSMIEAAASPLNIVANKTELVHHIGSFALRAAAGKHRSIVEAMQSIARGDQATPLPM